MVCTGDPSCMHMPLAGARESAVAKDVAQVKDIQPGVTIGQKRLKCW